LEIGENGDFTLSGFTGRYAVIGLGPHRSG
jgi:hypothetical protein